MSSQAFTSVHPNAATSDVNVTIDTFVAKLKRRQVQGSYAIALETLQLLMLVGTMLMTLLNKSEI